MELIIISIFIIIVYFIYQGFCTRCPNCGYRGLNKHLQEDKTSGEFEELMKDVTKMIKSDSNTSSYTHLMGNPNGFANKTLTCKKCMNKFSRNLAMSWQKTANKLGEEIAIEEYRKLKS